VILLAVVIGFYCSGALWASTVSFPASIRAAVATRLQSERNVSSVWQPRGT